MKKKNKKKKIEKKIEKLPNMRVIDGSTLQEESSNLLSGDT